MSGLKKQWISIEKDPTEHQEFASLTCLSSLKFSIKYDSIPNAFLLVFVCFVNLVNEWMLVKKSYKKQA